MADVIAASALLFGMHCLLIGYIVKALKPKEEFRFFPPLSQEEQDDAINEFNDERFNKEKPKH